MNYSRSYWSFRQDRYSNNLRKHANTTRNASRSEISTHGSKTTYTTFPTGDRRSKCKRRWHSQRLCELWWSRTQYYKLSQVGRHIKEDYGCSAVLSRRGLVLRSLAYLSMEACVPGQPPSCIFHRVCYSSPTFSFILLLVILLTLG